jgi:hypothetical protein
MEGNYDFIKYDFSLELYKESINCLRFLNLESGKEIDS